MGIAPTGKQVAVTGIAIMLIANGKLVEEWANLILWILRIPRRIGRDHPHPAPRRSSHKSYQAVRPIHALASFSLPSLSGIIPWRMAKES